ncbi:MAG: ribose-phosphate pyrophosphokinase [Actinomycetia bacterium]|nr:ribose-phosphate pyrophosphokinase [Actinomycetes bacterium]
MLFALDTERKLGQTVAAHLGVAVADHDERHFESGESKTRPAVNVRGRDTYVVASLAGDQTGSANDKLCRVLFFVGALKEASARSVTVVAPYLCYSRKDQQTKARDPIATRYVAQMFEAVGTDRLVTLDVHNLAAFQNASRCHTDHLQATQLFVDYVCQTLAGADVVVVSPDIGGVKRAERFRMRLEAEMGRPIDLAFAAKLRNRGVISGPERILGDVEGRVAIVFDDMIASGGTMRRVADMLVAQGANMVYLAATHGVLTPDAAALFSHPSVAKVIVTDTVEPDRLSPDIVGDQLVVLGIGPLVGEAVARIHSGGSLSELLHLDT